MSDLLPEMRTEVPGPRSRELAARLERVECPEVTCLGGSLIFWERASGSSVIDVDGNRYVDLVAGFGVASLGYAHPALVEAAERQARALPHAMGDVHPARVKVELLEALDAALPGDLGRAILSSSGSDAVESALKTALRATGRPDVIAFEGAYHGLGLGALDTTHRAHFRTPFLSRLPHRTHFVPFGDAGAVRAAVRAHHPGAILVEPIQGRGGLRVPPEGFLRELRRIADETRILLIADEVYTGMGRTGHWLACQQEEVLPDLVALGKGLGGGFPISACAGRPAVMQTWGASRGEAIHTSTHLGNPLGCAIALEVLARLRDEGLVERARRLGEHVRERLEREVRPLPGVRDVRGRGLLWGIELDDPARAARVVDRALRSGWILLAEGEDARVLTLTPALTIPEALLDAGLDRLAALLSSGS